MSDPLKGFLLATTQLPGRSYITTTYTLQAGKRKAVMRLSKSQPAALLTPMACLQFQLRGKEHAELPAMKAVSLLHHPFDWAASYLGLTLLQHWASLVLQSQGEQAADERIYRLLDHCMTFLISHKQASLLPVQNLYFEIWLLHLCGVLPKKTAGLTPSQADGAEDAGSREMLRPWMKIANTPAIDRVFKQKIGDFAKRPLELGFLGGAVDTMGQIWQHYLAKEFKIRQILTKLFKERGLT